MKRKEAEELMDTLCERDSKQHHRWDRIGVSLTGYNCALEEIFQCYQCKKILRIELEELHE